MDPLLFLLLLASGISAASAAATSPPRLAAGCGMPGSAQPGCPGSDGYNRFPPPPSSPILFITPASPPPPPSSPPPPSPPPPSLPVPCYSPECGDIVQLVAKVNEAFCLTNSEDGSVFMTLCSNVNMYQYWRRDLSWGGSFQDSTGFKAFTLVNLATSMALRHGVYENDRVNSSWIRDIQGGFLWTMSETISGNYHTIRSCQNIGLNLDIDHGDRKRGGVKEHNPLILFQWKEGDNQLWRMLRYQVC